MSSHMKTHPPSANPSLRSKILGALTSILAVGAPPAPTAKEEIEVQAHRPANNAKQWGMSAACARITRKSKLHRMGWSHAKI